MRSGVSKKTVQVIIVIIGWPALLFQFYLILVNRIASVAETIMRYFGYFTILTNILVAVAFTSLLWGNKWKSFFSKAPNLTAITVYILVVGIVYNAVLRGLYQFNGLQKWVDEALHLIIPLAVLIYWSLFAESSSLQWKAVFKWLWYPMIYCVYTLIRGAMVNFYPYPFIDVIQLGYSKVLINCVYVTMAFFVISLLLIGIGKLLNRESVDSSN